MPNWAYILLCLVGTVICWFLPVPIRKWESWLAKVKRDAWKTRVLIWPFHQLARLPVHFIAWCEYPKKAWGVLSFLVGLLIFVQVLTNYQQGIIYWLCTNTTRNAITTQQSLSLVFQDLEWPVAIVYWFAILCIVLGATSLARGIKNGKKGTDEESVVVSTLAEMKAEISPLIKSNTEVLEKVEGALVRLVVVLDKTDGGKRDGEHKPD